MTRQGLRAPPTTRTLDMAKGILIGLRRCGPDAAFDELVAVARRNQVPLFAMSAALIAVAAGDTQAHAANTAAQHAAEREWHDLLAHTLAGRGG